MAEETENWALRIEKDESYRRELTSLFKDLRSLAISNAEYYQDIAGPHYEKLFASFNLLYEHLDVGIEPSCDQLIRLSHLYDLDPSTPANGYRSMVKVTHRCCVHLLQLSRYISVNRESFIFRAGHYSRELEAYVTTLGQLRACLYYLQKLIKFCGQGMLFPEEESMSEEEYSVAESLMIEVETLSQDTFYGRCLGFQYCDSMVKPLSAINFVMASFSDGYYQQSSSTMMKVASSVISGGKYFIDPEVRAEKVVDVTRNGGIQFCKAFWSLAENNIMHSLPLFVCPPVQVDKVIVIAPNQMELPRVDSNGDVDGHAAKISPPCAHIGPAPLNCRLISYHLREGQEKWKSSKESKTSPTPVQPRSAGMIIHFHGGGFVAQSSASHEVYLRHWAKETGVPIFCVDYSLAPECPFPRQLEECFFAYCWALKNCRQLGSTGERVVITGDSAGGNLAATVTLRAIAHKVRRPTAIMCTYGCMLVKYVPSPSRILALMDPLLPLGVLSRCLAAYAGLPDDTSVSVPSVSSPRSSTSLRSPVQTPTSPPPTKELLEATFNLNSTPQERELNANDLSEELVNGAASPEPSSSTSPASPRNLSLDLSKANDFKKGHCRSPSSPTVSHSSLARHHVLDSGLQPTTPTYAKVRHFAQSPVLQFRQMPIGSNPFMSPYHASDDLLKQFPPVFLVACQLDPMLDDSVMFAHRLRDLGQEVTLDVLPDLPHGFLNFTVVSSDAKQGSDFCIARLKHMLRTDEEQEEEDEFEVLDSDEPEEQEEHGEDEGDEDPRKMR